MRPECPGAWVYTPEAIPVSGTLILSFFGVRPNTLGNIVHVNREFSPSNQNYSAVIKADKNQKIDQANSQMDH